jgi:hypothetical protein
MQWRARALALAMTICPATALASRFPDLSGLFETVGFVILFPVYVWIITAFIVGLAVENSRTAAVWLWVFGVFTIPVFAVAIGTLYSSSPGSGMHLPAVHDGAVLAVLGLLLSHAWAFGLLIRTARSGAKAEKTA